MHKQWPVIAVSVIMGAAIVVFACATVLAYIREWRSGTLFNKWIEEDERHGIPNNRPKPPPFALDSDGDPLNPEHLSPTEGGMKWELYYS